MHDLNSFFSLHDSCFWRYFQSDAVGKMSDQVSADLFQKRILLAQISWMIVNVGQNLRFSTYKMKELKPRDLSGAIQI